jgi:hypothetical protein
MDTRRRAELWGQGVRSFMVAQQNLLRDMTDGRDISNFLQFPFSAERLG